MIIVRAKKQILFLIIILILGCKEYNIKTTINEDGTVSREVVFIGDSAYISKSPFPIPSDSTWSISKAKERAGKAIYSALKLFDSFDDLSSEYAISDTNKVNIRININKNFRWFYTDYFYTETYARFNLFGGPPVSEYLNDTELDNYISGNVNEGLNKKIEDWTESIIFEEFYNKLRAALAKKDLKEITAEEFDNKKSEMLDSLSSSDSADEIVEKLSHIFNTQKASLLRADIERIINEVARKIEVMMNAGGKYTNTVGMPGKITLTNATKVEGNLAKWDFDSERFIITDLRMHAESRVMNPWAILISLILALIFILLVGLPRLRKAFPRARLSEDR